MANVKKREIPFKIHRPGISEYLNMIIYGDTGVGKTYLAGTTIDYKGTNPTLFIDFEGGTKTLFGKEIDVVKPNTWKEVQSIYEFLVHENDHYKSVVLDSMTELQKKFSLGYILNEISDGDEGYLDLVSTPTTTRQDWLKSGNQMRKIIRGFRDLAYMDDKDRRLHVIMIALERYDEKKQLICPQLSGVLGVECGAMVDILARLSKQSITKEVDGEETSKVYRHLLTDDYIDDLDVKYLGKNRGGNLGSHMWNPNIEKLCSFWSRNVKGDE